MPDKFFSESVLLMKFGECVQKILLKQGANFTQTILELLKIFLKNLMGILNSFLKKFAKLSIIKI